MSYIPTNWVDGQTPVNAENLNKLEQAVLANDTAIEEINTAMESGDFKGDPGVSGVYVGSGDMPEGYNIQIDPNGEADVPATQEWVAAQIQAAINATWEAEY
jgi:hypothetical protein